MASSFGRILFLVVFSFLSQSPRLANADGPEAKSLYHLSVTDVSGTQRALSEYRGKVALVVNTASGCGFTPQYKGLEELFQRYKDRGFVVLAFPSNDFGQQEPGSNAEIKKFCELKYKTTFPVFAKGPVSGEQKQPVYRFLTELSAKEFQGDPGWNFVKFLVDKEGIVVDRFSSMTTPMSSTVTQRIEDLLS
jgi:glutathione peroxidase